MKKISTALLKASTLLLSFSGITIAVILRDQITPPLMIATIAVSIILIIIVISLLVKEEPTKPKINNNHVVCNNQVTDSINTTKVNNSKENGQRDKSKKVKNHSNFTLLDSGDIIFRKNNIKVHQFASEIEDIGAENKLKIDYQEDNDNISTIPNPYNIDLEISEDQYENLLSILDDLETIKITTKNPDFDNFDLLPRGIKYYQYNYGDIPVVSLIKQRDNSLKVMIGNDNKKLYELSIIKIVDYPNIQRIYSNSNHIQSIISGGRYRYIDLESNEEIEISEPLKVQLRLYHSLHK